MTKFPPLPLPREKKAAAAAAAAADYAPREDNKFVLFITAETSSIRNSKIIFCFRNVRGEKKGRVTELFAISEN